MIYSTNVILWNSHHELLVVSRKEDPTKFCLPGGKVDTTDYDDYYRTHYYKTYSMPAPDLDTLRRAASRELKEETGVYIRPDDLHKVHECQDNTFICTSFYAFCKMLPDPIAVEPGTWVGWRLPELLVQERYNPFWAYMIPLFEKIGVR